MSPKKFRKNYEITMESDMDKIIHNADTTKLIILSFKLKEEDLNLQTSIKIINFLDGLKQKHVSFKISRPLPRCLFGLRYGKITKKFDIPKNCFECKELFTTEKDIIKSCDVINKKGPKICYMPERQQIWEYFDVLKMKKEPAERCKKCLYFKRKQCNCFILNKNT